MSKISKVFFGVYILIFSLMACNFKEVSNGKNTNFKKPYNLKKAEEYWLFVGNPGAGKNTIINSLLKQETAKAGISASGGLTGNFALYPHGNITYIDTPYLEDIKNSAKAAKEIEKALKQDGKYRIFLILDSNRLRLNHSHLNTMETLLDAIDLPEVEFNIIINKCTEKDKKYINDKTNMPELLKVLNAGKYKTNNIIFITIDVDILNGSKYLLTFEKDVLDFMHKNSASIFLPKEKVRHINAKELSEPNKNMNHTKIDFKEVSKKVEELKEEIRKEREMKII